MSQNPSKLAMGDYDAKMKANKETLDAKKQAEAVAGKVGGPGNASAAPPTGPAATPAPAATPPVTAAPAAAAPVAAPVADNNPLANGVQAPFTEAPAATAAPVAAPVADAIPAVNIPTVAAG
jgi:hypothetical protein